MRISFTFAALALATSAIRAGDDWPQFRGPLGTGVSDAKSLVTEWAEDKNVRWKTAIHGKAWSSPVIRDDQVWMTTVDEVPRTKTLPPPKALGQPGNCEQITMFAVCVNRKTGKIEHDIKLAVEKDPAYCIDFNSYGSPTPVIDEGHVYVHFGSHGTWCIDMATGKPLWDRLDLKCNHFRGPGSSPIIHGDLLYLTFDGFDYQYVTALEKKTGKTVWKKDRNIKYPTENGDYKKAYSTPSVFVFNGKAQLVSPASEATIAYDVKTGEEVWRVTHGGMNEAIRPILTNDLIILSSGHTSQLLAVKAGQAGDLTKDGVAWKTARGAPSRPSPVVVDGLLFAVSDKAFVSCLEVKSGKQLWQERIGGDFSASPVYAAGNIYIPDQDGKTHVIAAAKEFKSVAVNKLDAGCMASPAVVGDALFLRTKTHLYCIGPK